jgi:hypothetical protein
MDHKIADKIRKLAALARDKGATPGERDAACQKLGKLICPNVEELLAPKSDLRIIELELQLRETAALSARWEAVAKDATAMVQTLRASRAHPRPPSDTNPFESMRQERRLRTRFELMHGYVIAHPNVPSVGKEWAYLQSMNPEHPLPGMAEPLCALAEDCLDADWRTGERAALQMFIVGHGRSSMTIEAGRECLAEDRGLFYRGAF